MSYTPGHDTANFLNRTHACPCCDGKGIYTANYGMSELRTYECEACDGSGRIHVMKRGIAFDAAPRNENGWVA